MKNLHSDKIERDEESCKNFLIYYIGYVTPNCVKLLYLIINEINSYIEETNGNYLKIFENIFHLKIFDTSFY